MVTGLCVQKGASALGIISANESLTVDELEFPPAPVRQM